MLLGVVALAFLHHIDHVLRADNSGWPFTPDLTPFTISLLVYPIFVLDFVLLRHRPWVRVGLGLRLGPRVRRGPWLRVRMLGSMLARHPALERVIPSGRPRRLRRLRRLARPRMVRCPRLMGARGRRRPPVRVRFRRVMAGGRTCRLAQGGGRISGRRVGARDDDVPCARIGLAGGEGEVAGRVARDLEHGLVRADPDRAHLAARDAASATDERQQPARIGAIVGAQVDAERDAFAGELGVALPRTIATAGIPPRGLDRNRAQRLARGQPPELPRHEPA